MPDPMCFLPDPLQGCQGQPVRELVLQKDLGGIGRCEQLRYEEWLGGKLCKQYHKRELTNASLNCQMGNILDFSRLRDTLEDIM